MLSKVKFYYILLRKFIKTPTEKSLRLNLINFIFTIRNVT